MRRFTKDFKKDDRGHPRNWLGMEEKEIRERFLEVKEMLDAII